MTLLVPGVYAGIANDVYHGACTAEPAISSTGARQIMQECPAYHRHRNPHLNPDWTGGRKREFSIGTAAHLLFLEPDLFEQQTVTIDAPNYSTGKDGIAKANRSARDKAYEHGKIPLLMPERALVLAMRAALEADPIARAAIGHVTTEETIIWVDPDTGCWCKARPDIRPQNARYLIDYKTGATSEPAAFQRAAWTYRYWQQLAWYADAMEAGHGHQPDGAWIICQSKDPPYLVTTFRVAPDYLQWGRLENVKARELFVRCLNSGVWPGYADRALTLTPPPYAERQLREAFDDGRYAPEPELEDAA